MEYITGIQKLIHKKREALTAIIRLLSCSPTSTVQSAYSNRCFFIPYYFRMNLSFKEKKMQHREITVEVVTHGNICHGPWLE